MKKTLISMVIVLASSSVLANDEAVKKQYPDNPILRPLTLTDGTVAISGALAWNKEKDESRAELNLNAAYGLTDDFTIGFGGLNYRVLARKNNQTGLELAVGLGVRGYYDSINNGDAIGYGADFNGKYVFDKNIAMTFSVGYINWNEEKLENKSEYRYSIGVQTNIAKDWTAFANYTYRDLKDFTQEDAHNINVGLNYAYNKDIDIGLFTGYSDFDALENGYKLENSFEHNAGVYVTYRF